MKNSHLHVISSLGEATTTVLFEAMSYGVPTMTLDHCGMAGVVCEECGIKIPIHSYNQVISDIAKRIDELIEKGIPKDNIIYLDLDRREYREIISDNQLDLLIEEKSKGISGVKYLFIDEVQNVKNFELVLNGFRIEDDYSIFITGSNSYLLSGELSTKLTERYIEFEIFTLNFEEYQSMKNFMARLLIKILYRN